VLRKIFGPHGDKVIGEWRRLHNEELYDLYSLLNIIWVIKSRRMRRLRQGASVGERKSAYRVLVGKPEGRRPLGRHRHKWEDNMKIDLRDVRCGEHGLN
jgi:hypothetical protein